MRNFMPLTLALCLSAAFAAERGEMPLPIAEQVPAQCDQAIAAMRADAASIEKLPLAQADVAGVLVPWSKSMGTIWQFAGWGDLMANAHPDDKVRAAQEACGLKVSEALSKLLQSGELYARFKAVQPADAIDAETLKGIRTDFENKGVNLPKPKREQMSRLQVRLDKLEQDFARNIRENKTRLAFSEAALKGVPADTLKNFKRDEQGNYLIGFDYPEYLPVMENAEDAEVRRKLYMGFLTRGGNTNLAILHEVINLRKQLSILLGYPSYASWATRNAMVGKPAVVAQFLSQVKAKVAEVEKRDLAELAAEKSAFTGVKDAKLARWDQLFYQKRVERNRYKLEQAAVRAQFPTEPTINWMMAVTSRLYGVEFRLNAKLPVWHVDVKGYDVYDKASGEYLSSFYLDLFPRDGKYKHAAAFPVRPASTLQGVTPVSVLVTNFNRDGFDQEELATLFHEFGHIMHGVLSRTRYTLNAGTSTKRDFVEAPSQMYEEWSRNPASMALWNEVCPSCKPIDMGLVAKMNEARRFGQGLQYARQWLYASYDMTLAGPIPQNPLKLWQAMEAATPLGHVAGTQFPGTFGHIVGGYAAGYYGYMWSEVLALDMRAAFGKDLMNAEVGMRFRKTILENGSQMPEMDLVRRFLGREPNSEAFFREITGQHAVGAIAP